MAIASVPVEIPAGTPPAQAAGGEADAFGNIIPVEMQTPAGEERLYAGKYKTVEELEKGYVEASKKLGTLPPPVKIENAPGKEVSEEAKPEVKADLKKIGESYAKTGSLSEEDYTALGKAGYARDMVDDYIRGQVALASQTANELASVVGGPEQMAGLLKWAGTNLPPEDIAAYNAALDTKNIAVARLALQGLANRYQQEFPQAPARLAGASAGNATEGVKPFANPTEQFKATRDPRYSTDKVYRDSVIARVMASSF